MTLTFSGLRSSEAPGDRRLDNALRGVREHQRPHHHDRGEGGGHDQDGLGIPRAGVWSLQSSQECIPAH